MEESLIQYCLLRFKAFFSQHISYVPQRCDVLDANDYAEAITETNIFVNGVLGITVPNERWMEYIRFCEWTVSARNIKSKKMFIGNVILHNFYFLWDDLADDVVEYYYEAAVKETKRLAEKYYEPQYQDTLLLHCLNWLYYETKLRKTEIRKKLFDTSLNMYWNARMMEGGSHLWIGLTAPIYCNDDYLRWTSTTIPSQLITRGIFFINDVVSFNKEKQQKETHNSLYFADLQHRGNFISFLDSHLKEIEEDIQAIKSLPEPSQSILLDGLYGNFLWTRDTPRYKNGVNHLNRRIEMSDVGNDQREKSKHYIFVQTTSKYACL